MCAMVGILRQICISLSLSFYIYRNVLNVTRNGFHLCASIFPKLNFNCLVLYRIFTLAPCTLTHHDIASFVTIFFFVWHHIEYYWFSHENDMAHWMYIKFNLTLFIVERKSKNRWPTKSKDTHYDRKVKEEWE